MEKEYNKYLWNPKQPRVYGISPLTISGTPMSEEDVATSLKVENSQQRFQQNPVVKRSEQWEAQQKQREEEIATSKKWLELHPEDESDSPYTILERGKHQAIVDGKDPSYYEKMIDDGKQFTKGALSVLSLPYLGAAAAGAYGYGASLGARGLFAGQGIYGLANKDGVRKTANLIKSGDYGRAALSGAGDALNAAMILPGAKFLGNAAKYGLKSTVAGDMLGQNVRYIPQSGKLFYNSETIPENRIPVGAYRQSPEQMAEKINQLNTKGFTVLGHGTGFGGQEAAKNIEREGLKIFKRDGTGLVEDADITNTASFLGGSDTATKLSNWPHLNSRYISLFPSTEFRYVNGNRRYFDLFPKGTFEYIPEKSGKSLLDYEPGGWSVVEGKGGITKPSASIGYYDSKEGIFYPNSNYQYKPYSPKSKERTYLGLLERPSKLSASEWLGIPKGDRGNLSQDQLDALEDLASYMQSGRYKNKFVIDQSGNFAWKSNLGSEDTLVPRAFADAKGDFGTRWARASTKEGTFKYIEDQDYGAPINGGFTAAFPNPDGMKWGPGELTSIPESKHSINIIMTSPKVDAIDAGLEDPIVQSLSNTIDPGIVKNWWIRTKQMSRPGSYLSGDAGKFPIGFKLLQDVDNHKFGNIANDLLYPDITNEVRRQGLSPDSYASIVKQGLRDGNSLRFGEPFFKWNPSAVKNKYIYDAFTQYKKGEIPIDQYKETVDNWLKSIGVNRQSFIKDGRLMIPHPFVYYNKQGGILKRK